MVRIGIKTKWIADVQLEKRCLLLLAGDLTDLLDDEEILSSVDNASSLEEAFRELVARANEKGDEDNISVVLVYG